ncbi:MAG: GTPase HflX [Phycisphaeraceae bacterium]|nr:GTPase HflX [Phycisphaeraceae bacterium]
MPQPKDPTIKVQSERAVLAAVRLPTSRYDLRDPFGELRSLAEQAGAIVVGELEQRAQKPVSATFMGSGKVDELKALCESLNASTVIFDHELSPSQIANIEETVGKKVIDRSELILDIFASRATTHEAKLQVELAQLEYTYPRLRAMWDHLERIVGHGGIGGIGTRGPGEQQLEIDRRLVQKRRLALEGELAEIHARKRRMVRDRRADNFTVCIVGYTNAGKSTLFNTLTTGGAYADDRLFATLVTRTRNWDLTPPAAADNAEAPGGGLKVMLSDTVGFVRDLPHDLVASFRATLEEATHADLLIIVLDASDPAAEMQYQTVTETLDHLLDDAREDDLRSRRSDPDARLDAWKPPERLLLLNKVDRLDDNRNLLVWERQVPGSIAICARDAADPGLEALRARVRALAQGGVAEVEITLPLEAGRAVQLIETLATVLSRDYENGAAVIRCRIGHRQLDQVRSVAGRAVAIRTLRGATEPGG